MKYKRALAMLITTMSAFNANAYWDYNCESADGTVKLSEKSVQSSSNYHAGSNKRGARWTVEGHEFLIPAISNFRDRHNGKFGIKARDIEEEVCTKLENREVIPGNYYSIVKVRHTKKVTEIDYKVDDEWRTITATMACEYVGDFSHCRGWDAE